MILPFGLQNRPRKVQLLAGGCTLITMGLLAWLAVFLFAGPRTPRIVANNISRNFRACLINDQRDAVTAKPVWSAVQKAARDAPINAQHIVIPDGGMTTSLPYVNSLVQRRCGLIISAGQDLHDAVTEAAQENPHQHFINIGRPIKQPNVRNLPSGGPSTIGSILRTAAQPRPARRP